MSTRLPASRHAVDRPITDSDATSETSDPAKRMSARAAACKLECSCLLKLDRELIAVEGCDTSYQIGADVKVLSRVDIAVSMRDDEANDFVLALRLIEVTSQEISPARIVGSPARERIDIAHASAKMRLRAAENEGAIGCNC
jgi:hypothetical protein